MENNCRKNTKCEGHSDPQTRNCTVEVLDELYKNVSMARQAVDDVLPKVKSSELAAHLKEQYEEYSKFSNRICKLLGENCREPKDANIMAKMSTKIGIEMNTLTDPSDEHIAQMTIEGTTMGITDIIRLVRDYENSNCSQEALTLAKSIVSYQESAVEKIKEFL